MKRVKFKVPLVDLNGEKVQADVWYTVSKLDTSIDLPIIELVYKTDVRVIKLYIYEWLLSYDFVEVS